MNGTQALPRHIAIIMDGNGRWANQRRLPRIAGHRAGVEAVRRVVEQCARHRIEVLTLFAFSSENWRRPDQEVGLLMDLFVTALRRETESLHRNNIRLQVIGDRSRFADKLQQQIARAEALTGNNSGLRLVIAANYGGRWDITQAVRELTREVKDGLLACEDITEAQIARRLSLADLPEPDLFIRTGGEQRVSNFLLWHLAYTELYFTDVLWPSFDEREFQRALVSFSSRQRRFGRTGEQIEAEQAKQRA